MKSAIVPTSLVRSHSYSAPDKIHRVAPQQLTRRLYGGQKSVIDDIWRAACGSILSRNNRVGVTELGASVVEVKIGDLCKVCFNLKEYKVSVSADSKEVF